MVAFGLISDETTRRALSRDERGVLTRTYRNTCFLRVQRHIYAHVVCTQRNLDSSGLI